MTRLIRTFLVLMSLFPLLWAQSPEPERIDSLVAEALRSNPELRAEADRVLAAARRTDRAGTLEAPMFVYKLEMFPGTDFSQAQSEHFGLMQAIPFPAKLALESDIASIERDHAALGQRRALLDLIAEVRSAAAMTWGARAMLTISRENQSVLRQILDAAQSRYAVGKSSQQDVLKADIELTRLESQEIELAQELASSEALLRSLLHRRAAEPIGPVEEPASRILALSLDEYQAIARQNSPALAADSVRVSQAERMVSLRNHEYWPDLLLDIERVTMPMGGSSSWTFMATVSLPFAPWTLSRTSAAVQEAKAEKAETESRYALAVASLEARIAKAYAHARSLEHRMSATRERILPQTEQSLRSLLAAYQAGMTDFLMLLDAYRTYHEVRTELVRITAEYAQAYAELEQQAGLTGFAEQKSFEEYQP